MSALESCAAQGTIADDEATLERKLARQAELEKEAEALRSQARDRAEIASRSRRDQRWRRRQARTTWTTFLIWQVAELESEARAARDEADAKGAEVKAAKKSLRACADELGRRQAGVRAQCRPPSSYGIWTTFHIRQVTRLEGDLDQQRSQRQHTFQRARLEEVELLLWWRYCGCCFAHGAVSIVLLLSLSALPSSPGEYSSPARH